MKLEYKIGKSGGQFFFDINCSNFSKWPLISILVTGNNFKTEAEAIAEAVQFGKDHGFEMARKEG